MELLLGIIIGYLIFKGTDKTREISQVEYCNPPTYPRPNRFDYIKD